MRVLRFVVLVSLIGLLPVFTGTATAETPRVVSVNGNVLLNGEPMDTGVALSEGDYLRGVRSETAFVDLKFPNGDKIRAKGAAVTLDDLGGSTRLDLDHGKVFPAIQDRDERNLTIETPQAIMGIRGTKFFVSVSDTETYTCVCEGAVTLRRKGFWGDGTGPTQTIPAGYDLHFYENQAITSPKPNETMVSITWNEFADMGFEIPQKYDNNPDEN